MRSTLDRLREVATRARKYMDDDIDHPSFCVVPNGTVIEMIELINQLANERNQK